MYLTHLSRRVDRFGRADPLVRATNHAKKRYASVQSSGYGCKDRFDTLPALSETANNAYDLDAIMPTSNSLERRFQAFSGRMRYSIQAGSRSRQSHDKRGVQEILVHDRPNLKKEDFLSELEVEAIANIKTNDPQRRFAPLVEKHNSIFSSS